jgi:EAL domain-containing protein (putative c-di-GMP-specific phosphodiesterase class I)
MHSRPQPHPSPGVLDRVLGDPHALRVAVQPIVDLADGRVLGYEALSRFVPTLGLSPQAAFAAAARYGLGAHLEAKAIRAALALRSRPGATFLALNVSPSTLRSDALAAVLPEDLSGLVFELTENERLAASPSLRGQIARLRARGARFALDDVGAGFADLGDADLVAPDIVKLDRGIVASLTAKRTLALIETARASGAVICAEGIETCEQLHRLADLGISCGQGYAVGRPGAPWVPASRLALDACRGRARRRHFTRFAPTGAAAGTHRLGWGALLAG